MTHAYSFAAAGMLVLLVGCATAPKTAFIPPVGPAPRAASTGLKNGLLQVYSARQPSDISLPKEIFCWNDDFGRNDFLYEPAHTDYSIYSSDGKLIEHVRNARNYEDSHPAVLTLPSGLYTVKAQAEEEGGGTINLAVPVEVEAGKRTGVHVSGEWKPSGHYTDSEVVRLPTGQIAGWRGPGAGPMQEFTKTKS
jgi:hypothetical protein